MVSKIQRLGAGPGGCGAACCWASVPGPCRKRSSSCCRRSWSLLKTPPAVAAVLVREEAGQALGLVVVEPGVDAVGIAGAEQALAGDGVGCVAVGHFEQSGAAFADVRLGVMIPMVEQFLALLGCKGQGAALGHRGILLGVPDTLSTHPLPILFVKTHKEKWVSIRLRRHADGEGPARPF